MKNLAKLNGVKALSKKEQKSINGGGTPCIMGGSNGGCRTDQCCAKGGCILLSQSNGGKLCL